MNIGKTNLIPTQHYIEFHSDVEWNLVFQTMVSPTKIFPNKRRGKNRYTYIKIYKKFIIELHVEYSKNKDEVYIINAFMMPK